MTLQPHAEGVHLVAEEGAYSAASADLPVLHVRFWCFCVLRARVVLKG
jgi:hypothetical protein